MSSRKTLCGWGLKIESHCTELDAFYLFHPIASPPVTFGNLGGIPRGVTCSLHLQVNHRTPVSSSPKTRTGGTPPAFDKCHCITCLHACDFKVYVKCSCHLDSRAFPQIRLHFLMKLICISLSFGIFPSSLCDVSLATLPFFYFPLIGVGNVMTNN